MATTALYSISSIQPPGLKSALSGMPYTVAGSAVLEVRFNQAAVLVEIRVRAEAFCFYSKHDAGNFDALHRRVIPGIATEPTCMHEVKTDATANQTTWKGALSMSGGSTVRINLRPESRDACSGLVCVGNDNFHLVISDISLTVRSVATSLGNLVAELFDNERALAGIDDLVVVRLDDAPPLFVSKFVLQVRSPVFRAELNGQFREAGSRELHVADFPSAAVRCFLQLLHQECFDGSELSSGNLIAIFALGDKYDVPMAQEAVLNHVEGRVFTPEELKNAIVAMCKFGSTSLRTLLMKKSRQMLDDDLCTVICSSGFS